MNEYHDVIVEKKRIKNAYLSFRDDGKLLLKVPLYFSNKQIEDLLKRKQSWISSHKITPRLFRDGEEILLFGIKYQLKVISSIKNDISITDTEISVYSNDLSEQSVKKIVEEKFRPDLLMKGQMFLSHWERITGLKSSELRIKRMKSRWGSCNTKVGRIWLSTMLLEKDEQLISYVVLHELLHLKIAGHGKDFYQLMKKYMLDYLLKRRELNQR